MQLTYIWLPQQQEDSYAQFIDTFLYTEGRVELKITADYQFAAYINGSFAANSQAADLPEYKSVASYEVTGLCRPGENRLMIQTYHPGEEWSQSRKMTAALGYALVSENGVLAASSEKTLCRMDPGRRAGDLLTGQLGLGCCFDLTAEETPWSNAAVVDAGFREEEKTLPNTGLHHRTAVPQLWGQFCLDGGETAGQRLQKSWQRPVDSRLTGFPVRMHSREAQGVYLLCDLGGESAGYPWLCVECKEKAQAWLGWGEHLADGRIRTFVGGRNFAVEITLGPGRNVLTDYLRRIGGQYLCLFVQSQEEVTVHGMGVWEERYPLQKPVKDFGDRVLNLLYETGRRTLELCMHQHYEDCPWREQALYGMDSRNQMLFGYGAFSEYAFPRANLRLMARCIEEDGLLPLCPPSRNTITIPSFSAYWVMAVYENAMADHQADFVAEMLPSVERVMATFMEHTQTGAVHTFGEIRYWNFHEWSEGLDGGEIFRTQPVEPVPDALLSAVCCRAAQAAGALEALAGRETMVRSFRDYARELARGFEQFYVPQRGCFASYRIGGKPQGFHELTQALMLSTGLLPDHQAQAVTAALKTGEGLVPITLAGLVLKYEGLLRDPQQHPYVLQDLQRIFLPMLAGGTGTYWETALGQGDFDNAGSLCHGWSAVPCYVLDRLFGVADKNINPAE